jgi:hypothetical protein
LEVNIACVRAVDEKNRGATRSDQGRANLKDEARAGIILRIKRQDAARGGRGVKTIDARRKRLATEIAPTQVIGWWRS